MAHQIKNDKGFLIIKCRVFELMQIQNLVCGICDYCGNADFDGYLCCALGHTYYCEKCYKDWVKRATRYEEDIPFETKVFEEYKNAFLREGMWTEGDS